MSECKKTEQLNKELIKIIKDNQINPKDLAKALGKTHYNLWNWLNGKKNYSFKTLVKIADAIGLDAEVILKNKEE